jgi:hypothetical protein
MMQLTNLMASIQQDIICKGYWFAIELPMLNRSHNLMQTDYDAIQPVVAPTRH